MGIYGYRVGASIRDKRKLKQAAEVLDPILAPHLDRLDALEARVEALESGKVSMGDHADKPVKRGPGRPPKEGA